MALNRSLTTKEYADIAFTLPHQFLKKYTSMDQQQCNEIIYEKDKYNKTLFDHFKTNISFKPILIFIFKKLSPEQLASFCLTVDKNNKTALHKLAAFSGTQDIIDLVFGKISRQALSKVLAIQDNDDKTIFHYQESICSIDVFNTILDDDTTMASMNKIAILQDCDGKTILHHFANARELKLHCRALIEKLSNEAFNHSVILKDSSKNNILYYFFVNPKYMHFRYELLQTAHQKGMQALRTLNSVNYINAVMGVINTYLYKSEEDLGKHFIDQLVYYPKSYKSWIEFTKNDLINELNYILIIQKILTELFLEIKNKKNISLNAKKMSFSIANILYLLSHMHNIQKYCETSENHISTFNMLPIPGESAELKKGISNLFSLIFEIISLKEFINGIKEFNKNSSLSKDNRHRLLVTLHDYLQKMDYIPYLDSDPLTIFEILNIKAGLFSTAFTMEFTGKMKVFQNFLFNPAQAVLEKPKEFTEFYQKIMHYQFSLHSKFNRGYLKILDQAVAALKERDKLKYPDNLYSEYLNKIEIMLNNASMSIKNHAIDDALKLKLTEDNSILASKESSDVCFATAAGLPVDNIDKAMLEYNGMKFLYHAVTKSNNDKSYLKPVVVVADATPVEEKKDDNAVTGLDANADTVASTIPVAITVQRRAGYYLDGENEYLSFFNARIDKCLALESDAVSTTEIDEENYRVFLKKYYFDIKDRNQENRILHIKDLHNYMRNRAAEKPSFQRNSAADYNLRKAYYDACIAADDRDIAIYNKLDLISLAVGDARLSKGMSHRFLDLMKSLKKDYEILIFLFENRSDLPQDAQHLLPLAFMPTGVKLTYQQYANIAIYTPECFRVIHKLMTPSNCNEMIQVSNTDNENILHSYTAMPDVLLFILINLTKENFNKVILTQDRNNKTLLHQKNSLNTEILNVIFNNVSIEILSQILIMQDKNHKTILHNKSSLIKRLEKDFDQLKDKFNDACNLQDDEGKTILHYLAESTTKINLMWALINCLTAETINRILILEDKNNKTFIHYLIKYQPESAIDIYEKILAKQLTLGSDHSSIVMYNVIKQLEWFRMPSADHHYLLRICNIIKMLELTIRNKSNANFIFQSVKFFPRLPALIYMLSEITYRRYTTNYPFDIIKNNLTGLFNAIPIDLFLKEFKASNRDFKYDFKKFIEDMDYFPYRDMDPLKITHAMDEVFETNDNHPLYYTGGMESRSYLDCIRIRFENLISSHAKVKVFDFYQKVIDHQLTLGTSFNKEYIKHLSEIINHFESKNLIANDPGIKKFRYMLFSLKRLLSPADPAMIFEVDLDTEMSIDNSDRMAHLCGEAIAACKDDIWRARLTLNRLHFLYKSIQTHEESQSSTTIGLVVEDEKAPESKQETVNSALSKRLIVALNQEVYKTLNIATDTISNWNQNHSANTSAEELDIDKFIALVTQLCEEIKILSQVQWDKHLNEFTKYINYRKAQAPFLFSNSEDDLLIRTAYYNLVKDQHDSLADIKDKLQLINEALANPKLKSGLKNHRCLDCLTLLKKDLLDAESAYAYEHKYLQINVPRTLTL